MHGNLKMMFNEPVDQKFVHAFNSTMEMAEITAKIDHEDPSYDESRKNHIQKNILT